MDIFRGIFRKLALLSLAVTALGWFLFIIGYGIATVEDGQPRDQPENFPQWVIIFGGLAAMAAAIAHAALPMQPIYSILGGVVAFLGSLFVASLGMSLYFTGILIRSINEAGGDQIHSINLQFTGSLFAILGWMGTMILASFYDYGQSNENERKYSG